MNASSLNELIKTLRAEAKAYDSVGRRPRRFGDPAKGLEYNGINTTYRVSKKIWDFDIARSPQVVRSFSDRTDVHNEAWKANSDSQMVNYRDHRAKGRGR